MRKKNIILMLLIIGLVILLMQCDIALKVRRPVATVEVAAPVVEIESAEPEFIVYEEEPEVYYVPNKSNRNLYRYGGKYYLYVDGVWYESDYYDRGWIIIKSAPVAVINVRGKAPQRTVYVKKEQPRETKVITPSKKGTYIEKADSSASVKTTPTTSSPSYKSGYIEKGSPNTSPSKK